MIFDGNATLTTMLDGDFEEALTLDGDFEQSITEDGEFGEFQTITNVPVWEGSYEVQSIPWEAETVPMQGFLMGENLTVKEIHYFETSNQTGTTVFIGGVS